MLVKEDKEAQEEQEGNVSSVHDDLLIPLTPPTPTPMLKWKLHYLNSSPQGTVSRHWIHF